MAAKPEPSYRTEMDILSRVAAKMGQYLRPDMVLDTALTEILSALQTKHGCIYLFDSATNTLTIRAHRQVNKRFVEAKRAIKPGEGCAGTAVITKEMFVPTKAERRFVCRESQELLELDCLAAIPIINETEVLGVVEAFAPVARRLAVDECELVKTICNQLGIAIKNASTYAGVQHALDNTKKLLQAAETITASLEFDTILEHLASLACELTQVSRAAIAFYDAEAHEAQFVVTSDEQKQRGLRRKVAGDALRTVYEKGRTVAVYDLSDLPIESRKGMERDKVKSILIVPLSFAGRTLGALYLDEPGRKHEFTPLEIDLAEGVARHAAAAIQNARNFESTQQALANAQALLKASEMGATILDPEVLLKQLARLAPKLMGISHAGIWLFDVDSNQLELGVSPAPEIHAHATCKIAGDSLRAVIYGGQVLVLEDWSGLPDPIRSLMSRQKVKSMLLAPLHYGSEIVGMFMLYDEDRTQVFSPEEIDFAEAISHQAAIGVVNARSFAEQRQIAETLQQSFVPSHPPHVPGIKFGVGYRSASEGAFVGGDFYDFLRFDGSMSVCVGDVSGHGIEAASTAGIAKSTIRAYGLERSNPASVLRRTNKIIARQTEGHQFITVNYGTISFGDNDDRNGRIYKFVSAGHPPPMLITENSKPQFLTTLPNLPVGVDENTRYRVKTARLPHKSFLVLYTDGLIEARRNGVLLGPEGLRKVAAEHCHGTVQELVDGILAEAEAYSERKLLDDIAVVALQIL